jgi:hypothetical protein
VEGPKDTLGGGDASRVAHNVVALTLRRVGVASHLGHCERGVWAGAVEAGLGWRHQANLTIAKTEKKEKAVNAW